MCKFQKINSSLIINYRENGVPKSYFLNNMFVWMSINLAPLFSLGWWLVMSFYLLVCIIKGNIMLSESMAGILGLHPFKY